MQGLFSGRMSQKTYVKATFLIWILQAITALALTVPTSPLRYAAALLILGLHLYKLTLVPKRFHDLGRPGKWTWALLVPLLGLYWGVVLFFRKGEATDNAYGLAPEDEGTEYTLPLIIALLALIVFGGLYGSHMHSQSSPTLREDPKSFTATEVSLQGNLMRTPCDAQSAYELSQSYLKTGHYQAALDLEKSYHARCSRQVIQLVWGAFEAAKERRDFPLAEKIVSDLIQKRPGDADYWGWRGMLYERQGELQKAARDFEEVLRLKPKMRSLPLNLVDAYRKLGEPCKARAAYERYVHLYPEILQDADIRDQQTALAKDCPTLSPAASRGTAPETRASSPDTQAAAG